MGMEGYIRTLYLNIPDREPENEAVVDHREEILKSELECTVLGFFVLIGRDNPPVEIIVAKLYRMIFNCETEPLGFGSHVEEMKAGGTIGKTIEMF